MQDNNSPFVQKDIKCPACGKPYSQRFFRQRLFIPEEVESDKHVVAYKWLNQGVQQVNPLYYSVFLCPHCHYADLSEDFQDPSQSIFGASALKAFKKGPSNAILFQFLGKYVNYEDLDFQSALNLHFLAILLASLVEDEDLRDAYKLGRLYLRVAWLYRELDNGAAAQARPAAPVEVQPEEENSSADDLLAAVGAMEECILDVASKWETVDALLKQRIREIAQSSSFVGANPYPACHAPLANAIKAQAAAIAQVKDVCVKDVTGLLGNEPVANDHPAQAEEPKKNGLFATPEAQMAQIKRLWPDVPTDERGALEQAIAFFQRAISSDGRLDGLQAHIRVSSLVVDLMMRCGNLNGALEMTRGMYRSAIDARQEMQNALREGQLGEAAKRKLEGSIKQASESIESAGELREQVLDKLVERDLAKIKRILAASNGAGVEEALAAEGIPPEVLAYLKKRRGM